MKFITAFMAVTLLVLASFFTYGVNLTLMVIIVIALTAIAVTPIAFLMYHFFSLFFSLNKRFAKNMAIKIANDKALEDTISSHLYFLRDMAPSVSSVSVVAFFVTTDASITRLIVMFFFGILMKYVARRMIRSFYRVIRKIQGVDNDRMGDK